MEKMQMIQADGLTKQFGKILAVNNISLKVQKGTIHGFLGPNGAGKTTTIKMLVGALHPTSGHAYINGLDIGTVDAKKVFGYLPEHPQFYDMTVIDYLVYIGRLCGTDAAERAEQLLSWLDLADAKHRKIDGFSAGMKQKLGLIQALIHDPELLILDEPTANLDPIGRSHLIDKIKILAKKGKTIFISSHILSEIEKMADFVTIIDQGVIKAESDIGSLRRHFEGNHYVLKTDRNSGILEFLKKKKYVKKAWIEDEKINLLAGDVKMLRADIPKILIRYNASLENFSQVQMSLENIFMKLVEGEKD
ncbi:MAG: ABC transporter ATP-binding protein [archaeon]